MCSGQDRKSNVKKPVSGEFAGGPVVRTPRFHCREHGFGPWSGNEDPTCCPAQSNKSVPFTRQRHLVQESTAVGNSESSRFHKQN